MDLSDWELPLLPAREVPAKLFQCHGLKYGALSFNPRDTGRFNAPNREYGITYLSADYAGAFAEKFLQQVVRDEQRRVILDQKTVERNCLCEINVEAARTLKLVDITGEKALHIGADGRLSSATDNPTLMQRWGLALWSHPQEPDGIYYLARHDSDYPSIALFDRARHLVSADCAVNMLKDKRTFEELRNRYRISYIRA